LTVGKEGILSGEAEVDQLLLSGEFQGRVHCRHASILESGLLRGELYCESLTIEEGGHFDGNCAHQPYRPDTRSEEKSQDYIEHSSAPTAVALETKE